MDEKPKELKRILESLKEIDPEKLEESIQYNKKLIEINPNLGKISERIVYDKPFLLEVSAAGYNPLDEEDVQNFIEKRPPKNTERNIILCGADKYTYLGQGEYDEVDINKFIKKNDVEVTIKKPEDVFLSDLPKKKTIELLLEKDEVDFDVSKIELNEIELSNNKNGVSNNRKQLANYFGKEDIQLPANFTNSIEIAKKGNVGEILEFIKELRALGFSNEEIKQEIKHIRNES